MSDGYCTCYPELKGRTADCGVAAHRNAHGKAARWRIFKCHCGDTCGSWWIGKVGSIAVAEFHSGAEALAAFARGAEHEN